MSEAQSSTLSYVIFIVLGTGMLFPWNCLISAVDYFAGIYGGYTVEFQFTVVYMFSVFSSITCSLLLRRCISASVRIIVGFGLMLVAMVVFSSTSHPSPTLTIVMSAFIGLGDGILQGALYGYCGKFPTKYMTAFTGGHGTAGVVASILRIATKLSYPQTAAGLRAGAVLYFALATALIVVCVLLFIILDRSPFAAACKQGDVACDSAHSRRAPLVGANGRQLAARRQQGAGDGGLEMAVTLPVATATTSPSAPSPPPPGATQEATSSSSELRGVEWGQEQSEQGIGSEDGGVSAQDSAAASTTATAPLGALPVFLLVWKPAACVFSVFAVTLCVFPGVLVEVPSTAALGDWLPVLLVAVFNVFDTISRFFPRCYQPAWLTEHTLWIPCALRLLFIPLFLLRAHGALPMHDAVVMLLVVPFALSTGYLATVCITIGTSLVSHQDKDTAATLIAICLVSGLTVGAFLGFALK